MLLVYYIFCKSSIFRENSYTLFTKNFRVLYRKLSLSVCLDFKFIFNLFQKYLKQVLTNVQTSREIDTEFWTLDFGMAGE